MESGWGHSGNYLIPLAPTDGRFVWYLSPFCSIRFLYYRVKVVDVEKQQTKEDLKRNTLSGSEVPNPVKSNPCSIWPQHQQQITHKEYCNIYFLDYTNITDKFGKTPIHMLVRLLWAHKAFSNKGYKWKSPRECLEFYKSRFKPLIGVTTVTLGAPILVGAFSQVVPQP